MRRRSALSVIGGAVAAMATPLSFGTGTKRTAFDVSLREKYVRACALFLHMTKTSDGYYPLTYSYQSDPSSLGAGKITVGRHVRRPFGVVTDDDWKGMRAAREGSSTSNKGEMVHEIARWRSMPIARVVGDRKLARQILAIAVGMFVNAKQDENMVGSHLARMCKYEKTPKSFVGVTQFAKTIGGFELGNLDSAAVAVALEEVNRGISSLYPSLVLSELQKIPAQDSRTAGIASISGSEYGFVLSGCRLPLASLDFLSDQQRVKYRHSSESLIDTGYLCPHTGCAVNGDSHRGYLWDFVAEPEVLTDGVEITVADCGDGFAVDFSTNVWVNKESFKNVIAFAVPKV